MYAVQFVEGSWWVGFRYSDDRFDKITPYGQERELAEAAATRMNRRSR